jgi:pilus assembly protein CpaB
MTPKQLIMLAFVASFLVALLLYFYLSGLEDNQQKKTQVFTDVVVAAGDIPERSVIQEAMLKTVHMPAELIQSDAIMDLKSAVGKIAKIKILQGDALTAKKLFTDAGMDGFIGGIPYDKRAISISITDTTGVSGFAKPGDYVDVMLITDKARKNTISGEMILQSILLLAINKSSDTVDGKKDAKKEQMSTATLAVSPEEAVQLAVAQSQGTIYLVLRPFKPKDSFVLRTEVFAHQYGQTTAEPSRPAVDDRSAPSNQAPLPPEIPAIKIPLYSIPVIRGNSVNMVEVQ